MTSSEKKTRKPFRLMFKFWLDVNKAEEQTLAESIEVLKEQRTFSKTLREGIRLINDLRQGKMSVLLELFPWVKEQIALELQAEQSQFPPTNPTLQEQLNRMEQLLLEQGSIPLRLGATLSPIPEPEPDFDIEIKQAGRDENNNSTYNFLIAGAINVYGNCNSLPLEIVEYGLRTGRIQPIMLKQTPPKQASAHPKAMDVPQFAVPDFDLEDFELVIQDTG